MAFKEGFGNLEGVLSELPNYGSRRDVKLIPSVSYPPMSVLGVTQLAPFGSTPASTNTGNGAMGAVTVGPTAKPGVYVLTITGTGATAAFGVKDPSGVALTAGAVGSAYNQGGISFTLADGAIDFVPGDTIYINVPAVISPIGTPVGGGTISNVTVGAAAVPGRYVVRFLGTGATAPFDIEGPDGVSIGHGVVGTQFNAGGIIVTFTDGTPDWAAGDEYQIVVGGGVVALYGKVNAADTSGLEDAAGILVERIDSGSAPMQGAVIDHDAIIVWQDLKWPDGATDNQKAAWRAQLEARGIQFRAAPTATTTG